MKKFLLATSIASLLTACSDPIDEASQVAEQYCTAIKKTDFEEANNFALRHLVEANENWFNKDNRKYRKVFGKQRCTIKRTEAANNNTNFTIYYSPSLNIDGSYVEVEYSSDRDAYIVVSDVFSVYQNFY